MKFEKEQPSLEMKEKEELKTAEPIMKDKMNKIRHKKTYKPTRSLS